MNELTINDVERLTLKLFLTSAEAPDKLFLRFDIRNHLNLYLVPPIDSMVEQTRAEIYTIALCSVDYEIQSTGQFVRNEQGANVQHLITVVISATGIQGKQLYNLIDALKERISTIVLLDPVFDVARTNLVYGWRYK